MEFVPAPQLAVKKFYESELAANATLSQVVGQSTQAFAPFSLTQAVTASCMRIPVQMTTYSTSIATSTNATMSAAMVSSASVLIYTRGTGASSESLYMLTSASASMKQQWSLSAQSDGSIYTVSYKVSYPLKLATSSLSASHGTTLTNFSMGSQSITGITGLRFFDIPLSTSLSSGQYWVGFGLSSASSGAAAATGLRVAYSAHLAASLAAVSVGSMGAGITQAAGVGANLSLNAMPGIGSFTTVGGVTTSALGFSNISSSATHQIPYFHLVLQP